MDAREANVAAILKSPRIKGKLVILCEGDYLPLEEDGRVAASPQMYRQLVRTPDSNFYKACVPPDWHGSRLPQFFNCGGRSDVIWAFQALLESHRARPDESYLSPEKLYAIVDVDLQPGCMPEDYPWLTTEDVHASLYRDGMLTSAPDERHRIWVTALVHKEAFFVLPSVEVSWEDGVSPFLDGVPLSLRLLHGEAARRLEFDADLSAQLGVVTQRLGRTAGASCLDCSCPRRLKESWLASSESVGDAEYEILVRALLTVAKIKPLWAKIMPEPRFEEELPAETYREQLALKVARRIADLKPEEHALAGFFAWLKERR